MDRLSCYIWAVRILIVDDDVELCGLLREFLEREGFTVTAEHNGAAAVDRTLREAPDLVVLDVMLPGLDGFEICSRLRANPGTAKLLILMLSAKAQDIDKATGLKVGADEYMAKPAAPADIVSHIAKLLAGKKEISKMEKISG